MQICFRRQCRYGSLTVFQGLPIEIYSFRLEKDLSKAISTKKKWEDIKYAEEFAVYYVESSETCDVGPNKNTVKSDALFSDNRWVAYFSSWAMVE